MSRDTATIPMAITIRKQKSVMTFLLLLWTLLASQICDALCPTRLTSLASSTPSSSLKASSSFRGKESIQITDDSSDGGNIARARQRDREAKTLYDYLGASPKDTQEQLKIRYTTLAKTLHPDSNPDRETQSFYYDLSEINAAWEVLKDPVERKRYDRSLQTKEITEGIESLVKVGIESFATTAIPFLKKTAVNTAAAVDASTKVAKEVNEQAKTAYGAFEIEQQIKAFEQKANAESVRTSKIKKELTSLPTKKVASLEKKQQRQQRQPLSSVEAQRILNDFQATATSMKPPPTSLSNEIKLLTDTEVKQREALSAYQTTEQASQSTARKMEQAMKTEETARRRLEEAQKASKEAKRNYTAAQEDDRKAKAKERLALQSSTKIDTMLQKTREKVRVGLLHQQDTFLVSRANELKKEIKECEKLSKNYLQEANALRIKAGKEQK